MQLYANIWTQKLDCNLNHTNKYNLRYNAFVWLVFIRSSKIYYILQASYRKGFEDASAEARLILIQKTKQMLTFGVEKSHAQVAVRLQRAEDAGYLKGVEDTEATMSTGVVDAEFTEEKARHVCK